MATEGNNDTQGPPPLQQSIIPDYTQLILDAIDALNEKDGSNKSSISKQIESTHSDLPAAHTTLLPHHLNKMKQNGQIVMVKNNYMRPDPNAPPKRGRGRPPKPKTPLPPGTVISPPRPRGRPPKDPFSPPKPKTTVSSGRPRGRPPKDPLSPPKTKITVSSGRPRGRPPKDPLSPPKAKITVSSGRPRGRPPKDPFSPPKPKTPVSSGRSRGRPPKMAKIMEAGAVPPLLPPPGPKRGRGRPRKV